MTEPASVMDGPGDPDPNISPDDLTRLFDTGPLGYVAMRADGVIERVNTTLLRWLGHRRSELVGRKTLQDLLSVGGRIYYDTHLRPLMHMQREIKEIALEMVCADGDRLPVLVNVIVRTDGEDHTELIEAIVFDATGRRNYEKELLSERRLAERSQERLQLMYEVVSGLTAASTVADIVDVITEVGARSISGASCSVWLLEPGERVAVRVTRDEESTPGPTSRLSFPEGGSALDELHEGNLVIVGDSHQVRDAYPLIAHWLEQAGRRSAAIAPLITDGQLHGVVAYGFENPHDFDDDERQAVRSLAAHAEQALRGARLLEAERRSRARLEGLFSFTTRLAEAVTLDDVIDALVASGTGLLGAAGVRVAMFDETERTVRFARGSGVGGRLDASLPIDSRSIGCEAIRLGELIMTENREALAAAYPTSPILGEPAFGRVVAVPLRRDDDVVGAWVLAFADAGPAEDNDVTLIRLFAEQAGHAAWRSLVHQSEVLARGRADLRRMISAALNRAATTVEIAQALTNEGRAAFSADALVVFATDPDDRTSLRLVAQNGLNDAVPAIATRVGMDTPAISRAFRSSRPLFVDGGPSAVRSAFAEGFEIGQWASAALLPLNHAGHPLGLIVALFRRDAQVPIDTRQALTGLAAEASVAISRARTHELEHQVAITLQQSMLPSETASAEGWRVDTSYTPGSDHLVVGGDLFDVTTRDDGRLFVVVGDVVGHGLSAAASMGQLRSAAKTLSLVTDTPAAMLEGLDEFARLTPGVRYSSLCCAIIHPDGTGRYASAGHPFPVIVHADGTTEILDGGRSALLGFTNGSTRPDAPLTMKNGSTLVMFTDGLVERRDADIDRGFDDLRQYLSRVDFAKHGVHAHNIAAAMLKGAPPDDDIVVVCVTRTPSPDGRPATLTDGRAAVAAGTPS